jgi:hypothetical protein
MYSDSNLLATSAHLFLRFSCIQAFTNHLRNFQNSSTTNSFNFLRQTHMHLAMHQQQTRRPRKERIMKRHNNLKMFSSVGGTALVIWLAFTYNNAFWWMCFAALGAIIAGWQGVLSYHLQRFSQQRAAAMEAVESTYMMLAFYDDELPLSRYARFQFQTAVDHADLMCHALCTWIYEMQKHFDNADMPKGGLQMADVPALLDTVRSQVVLAFAFIRDGSTGERPSILEDDWFDTATIFGESVRVFRTIEEQNALRPDGMKKAVRGAVAANARTKSETSTQKQAPTQAQDNGGAPVKTPAPGDGPPIEARRLTYQPNSGEEDVVTLSWRSDKRRATTPWEDGEGKVLAFVRRERADG